MATEKLGKAHAWENGPNTTSHRAMVGFLKSLKSNRAAQKIMGFGGKNQQWKKIILVNSPLAQAIEDMAPSLSRDGPNPEYPWPESQPQFAPASHRFDLWDDLKMADGRAFLEFVKKLLTRADTFL